MMFLKQKFKVGIFITAYRSMCSLMFINSISHRFVLVIYLFGIYCDFLGSKIVNEEEIIILEPYLVKQLNQNCHSSQPHHHPSSKVPKESHIPVPKASA